MAGFTSVLHVAHGHGTRSQAILCNVWFSATEHSPADAYVYIYMGTVGMVYTSVCEPSHALVSHNTGVAVQVSHMQYMYQCCIW